MPEPPPRSRRYSIGGHVFETEKPAPGLHVTATPIGNLGDITLRALATLAGADEILCEDTRVTAKLLNRYGIEARLTPYHDHNAAKVRPRVLGRLTEGAAIALVSDAGMPLISDPGYKLVQAALAQGVPVDIVPGPSASLAALALSGLPSDRFMFAGFLPEKAGERQRVLSELANVPATLIFFESAKRVVASLGDIATLFPDRDVAVMRELTKLHQEALRGQAELLAAELAGRIAVKGEITLLIAPRGEREAKPSDEDIDRALAAAALDLPPARAAQVVAQRYNLPRKDAYARLLALKDRTPPA
jgi:16S rRNA (cytidine1402-2'-O)-methyltransferase